MTEHLLLLLVGLLCATVAAFATSSPELSAAISSSFAANPQISVGDAVGSNVVNVGAILGIAPADSLLSAIDEAIQLVTNQDARKFYTHCGYACQGH
jgi:cation:H+ antiporter